MEKWLDFALEKVGESDSNARAVLERAIRLLADVTMRPRKSAHEQVF